MTSAARVKRESLSKRASTLAATLPEPAPALNLAFDSGHAFPGVLPDLTAEATRALTTFRAETLQYAPRPGLPALRQHIASYMTSDGASVTPDQVLVTNGAKHAIELICRLLLDEGDTIIVTAPTYFTAIPIFRSYGAQFIEVEQDASGIDVPALAELLERMDRSGERMPKFLYNVPDFHNPTGVSMSLDRRRALLELAVRHRFFIVEDSPYRKVRFSGDSLPSLFALDRADVVLHAGTFSKLMAPGLRVGWVAAAPALIARMVQLKSDGGSCPLTQRMIVEFLDAGKLEAHIARVQATYRTNRDRMLVAVRRDLPDVSLQVPDGGYYLWLSFPADVDCDALARAASATGVTVLAGSKFFARTDMGHPRNHMRVAYSHATPEEIDDGIGRLAEAYRAMMSSAAGTAR